MKPKVCKITFLVFLGGLSLRALAQAGDYDIPPPPPIEEYDDTGVETPYEEGDIIDGPVYEAPPPPSADAPDVIGPPMIPDGNPGGSSPGGMMRGGTSGGVNFSGGGNFNGGNFGGGKSKFGESDGKVRFQIVEGEFWEKGKKRGRAGQKKQ